MSNARPPPTVVDVARVADVALGTVSRVLNTPDADLDKPVKFFGQPSTVRNVLYIVGTHQHEHFGLTIAYARINGVVPPWTAARQAPQQEKEKPKQ